MFDHILVPTDLTDRTVPALTTAGQMARPGGRVTLLHVIETIPNVGFEELQSFYRDLEGKARSRMDDLVGRPGVPEVEITREIVYGRRAEEIVRVATSRGVDLIVLASHRIDLREESPHWGTISYKVGILSPCPVLLMK